MLVISGYLCATVITLFQIFFLVISIIQMRKSSGNTNNINKIKIRFPRDFEYKMG